MYPSRLIIFFFVLANVRSAKEKHKSREGRIFSFNIEEDDIKIDLDFTVPFISIPVKKSIGSLNIPTININPASLALSGAVVLGTTIILPFLLKNYAEYHSNRKYSRILENFEFGADAFLNLATGIVNDRQNLKACVLRISCWAAQRNHSEPIKFLNNVLKSDALSNLINSTAVEDAVISGINGKDCMKYCPCQLDVNHLSAIMRTLVSNV